MKYLGVRLAEELHTMLRIEAAQERTTIQNLIRDMILDRARKSERKAKTAVSVDA